ncbi:hypothetical protein TPHA_0I02000 [Tetrapisispora phaffii CBS 4417]|uniref:Mitochondrial import inner membrane translocase subunit TIM50 n=1 Tax=Tetrapisispora phaffii (strain ATCC 24235 / CBS 4417 / NBRC 1672 / NRRL Y-8282 / UCD 70-5) TaxID=1071381 RepID=G8BXS6_TETPH|nr:hypothetical protein TPHA_0I02000 [Tetrapisispora phaffii CBS 4417]CCE64704.1 hypothetical protein TPHA_0I02000 [Tetrapisispora phaffii CBS 4417]
MLSTIIRTTRASTLVHASRPLVLRSSSIFGTRSLMYSHRLLAEEKDSKSKDAKSILTDDMLFKAGVDLDAKDAGKESKEETTSAGETASSDPVSPKKKKKRQSSTDIKREKYANWMYIFSFSSLTGLGLYMTRDWDADEPKELKESVENGYTIGLMYQRFKARLNSTFSYFQDPPFPDLLPPPPPPPYQRPLTLVLTLEDFLVHSEWDQKHGWRTAKRPGTDYFLGYLSQYYEIVLFSSNYMMYSEKIAEKLDPIHAFVSYNLYKEHCVYKEGTHIKDLSKLNRDLDKVLIIDCDPNNYKFQPENAIPVKPWNGQADDELLKLIPFLEYLATQQVSDVKPILNSFHDKSHIPVEFNERVDKLKTKFYNDQKNKQNNWLLKALSVSMGNTVSGNSTKFPLDMIREEGEKNYVRFMKLIEEEKEKMKLQQEQLSGQTFTLKDYVEGNIPTPEEQMQLQMEKQKEIEEMFETRKKENNQKV